jgi:valine dehydrogenase (NAD+)
MDHIARECDFVTGRTVAHGGAGDSSVLTAFGTFQGMRAAAEQAWGEPTLAGRTVGVAGVGKVGRHLVRHLIEDGASVVVTDVHAPSVEAIREQFPQVTAVATTEELVASEIDVYAPDFCVNSGGVIQVADELHGFDFERAKQRAGGIFETTRKVFEVARADGVPPAIAADRLAERRIRDVGRLRGLYLR